MTHQEMLSAINAWLRDVAHSDVTDYEIVRDGAGYQLVGRDENNAPAEGSFGFKYAVTEDALVSYICGVYEGIRTAIIYTSF